MTSRRDAASPTMLHALRMARDGGLVRKRGGFWTSPGCPERLTATGMVPHHFVEIRTVEACVKRGLMEKGEPYDAPAWLTERGRAVLAATDGPSPDADDESPAPAP